MPFESLLPDRYISLVDYYGHGVLWAIVEDSGGQCTHICIDNREESVTRGRVYVDARHPAKPGSRLTDLGSKQEGDVVVLFSHFLDDPTNWHSAGGGLLDSFRDTYSDALLSIGVYDP